MKSMNRYVAASLKSRPLLHAVVVLALGLLVALPLTVGQLIRAFETGLRERAESVPLLLGARGNRFDQVFASLFYQDAPLKAMRWQDLEDLRGEELGTLIPLHLGLRAAPEGKGADGSAPVVGTDKGLFTLRGLEVGRGEPVRRTGEVVVGSALAAAWGIGPGDVVLTVPRSRFELSNGVQYRLAVCGVLEPTGGAEDAAMFVTMKTSWVLLGLGHGHEGDASMDHREAPQDVQRDLRDAAGIHFHGAQDAYPLSSVLLIPHDAESKAVAQSRFLHHPRLQIIRPQSVMQEMMERVLRIQALYRSNQSFVLVAAFMLLAAIFRLLMKLREGERDLLLRLGLQKKQWRQLLMRECLALSVLGILLGVLLTFAFVQLLGVQTLVSIAAG